MIDVKLEYAEVSKLRSHKKARVADEVRQVPWLDGPVCYVQLTADKVGEHRTKVAVDLVEEIVYARAER
jgi:hypothetical protein